MNARRALVTGGLGFVGSRLCHLLAAEGWEVAAVDDLSLGQPGNLSAPAAAATEVVTGDVRDAAALNRVLADWRPSVVFHLAAIHFIPACNADPRRAIDVNVVGTQSLLDACAATSSVEAVVLASTGAVYAPSPDAHDEESALGPTDIYGYTKLWTEQLGSLFHHRVESNVGIARLFNVFGPGETNPHLIPTLLSQVDRGGELALGNLSTRRDYVYVDDVAAGLLALADVCRDRGLLTCNLGREHAVDGHELIAAVERLVGRSLPVTLDPARQRASDRPFLVSDCARAHRALQWTAATDLEQGLAGAIERPAAAGVQID
jgi:UDP-glucose 4-epimerase